MPEIRQKMRGSTDENNSYLGPEGQIVIDIEAKALRIHDGTTLGGHTLPTNAYVAAQFAAFAAAFPDIVNGYGTTVAGDWNTAEISIGLDPVEGFGWYKAANINVNADSFITFGNGVFRSTDNVMSPGINWPGGRRGSIIQSRFVDPAFPTAFYGTQLYLGENTDEMYYRRCFNNVWSAWFSFAFGVPQTVGLATANTQTTAGHTHLLGFSPIIVDPATTDAIVAFNVGHYVLAQNATPEVDRNGSVSVYLLTANTKRYQAQTASGTILAGTWRSRGSMINNGGTTTAAFFTLFQRVS